MIFMGGALCAARNRKPDTVKTIFPRSYLAAIAQFMAAQDVRYYLKGVFVELLKTETRLVASDGNIAGVMRVSTPNDAQGSVIIPADTVALACKVKADILELAQDAVGGWSLAGIAFKPVDGVFPAYRRIIVTQPTGEAGYYNPELLMRFAKAGKALKRKDAPIVRQNGQGSALVHFYAFDDFVGIISPLRMRTEKMPDLGIPTWAAA